MKRHKVKVRDWKARQTQSATHFPHTLVPCSLKCLALLNLYLFTAYLRLALSYSLLPASLPQSSLPPPSPPFHHLVTSSLSSLFLSLCHSPLFFFFPPLYLGAFKADETEGEWE